MFFVRHNDWNDCVKNEIFNVSGIGVIFKKAAGRL